MSPNLEELVVQLRRWLALAAFIFAAAPLAAQQADVIRGRVTAADGAPVPNATVQATSIPGNVAKTTRAGRDGRYALVFQNGEGDYWISVAAIGFAPKRFELKRVADEDVLLGDATLAPAAPVLDAVRVAGARERPARNDQQPDVSGTEKMVSPENADPGQAGNLAAMAASVPGVQLIPGADGNPDQFSVFGLGGDQNGSTLNGLAFGGGDVPRDAATRASLATSPWDVSRGGFSGGQFALRTQSGTNFSARGLSSLLNGPGTQWTDRAGRAAGAEYTSMSLGASAAGPLAMDERFYSAGAQLDRRLGDLQSLTSADPAALRAAGVAPDSVRRLTSILGRAGVPLGAAGLPSVRATDRGLFLGSLDWAPPSSASGQSLNVTGIASVTRFGAPFGQVTALPTSDARRTSVFGAVQARHTNYVRFGVLTETSLGITRTRANTDPYLALPAGVVRVGAALDDGSTAIGQLAFGGSPTQVTSATGTTAAAQSQLSWFTADSRHRLKLATELKWDGFDQDASTNRLGTFAYNSLAELEAGTPASFTRLLAPRRRAGSQLAGAISLGDSWRPTAGLQLQYGVRVDGNRFVDAPARNPEVARVFGSRNDALPSRLYASPRAGFSYTYGEAPQLAVGSGFARGPRAVVRGGVGVFQNVPGAQMASAVMANTGLPDAARQLVCVGAAVPAAAWGAFLADPSSIPATCADGTTGSAFASAAPNVALFAEDWRAPRSLRANLNWSGAVLGDRLQALVDGTWSANTRQMGMVDLNFDGVPRFALAGEGGRPVFAAPGSIVPATGALAARDARVSPSFATVVEQRSDLRSTARQLSVGVRPLAFSTRWSWSLTWVYAAARDLAGGFGSTAGDPRVSEWARSAMDSRHQVVYGLSYNLLDWFPMSLSGSFRSGRPYTPMVAGDVNGDGFANDRAYVHDPSDAGDPAVAAEMRALLSSGSAAARRCLTSQLGRLAARNSCEGPWTSTSYLTVGVNPLKLRLPQRVSLAFYVNNALGAADLLLNGARGRRGWGQNATPDPTLLYVRGFDPAAGRFRYEVNPRFGATNLAQTISRNPVVVTAQLRLDVGFARERQLLTQSLDRGRARPGAPPSDQTLRGMGATLIPANPMALLLAQSDSLGLTRVQADSLATLNRGYLRTLDSIWTPVATALAALPAGYDRAVAYARYRGAREASVDALAALAPSVRRLLTPAQRRRLPPLAASSLDTRWLAFVRSSTAGGANLGVLGLLAQMGWQGVAFDAAGTGQSVMSHR